MLWVASLNADPAVGVRSRSGPILLVEIDHEIISTVILLLPLIQEGSLSVTSENMCMKYWLTT